MPLSKILGKKAGANGNAEKGGQPQISAASQDEPPPSKQTGAKSQDQRNMDLSVTSLLQQKQRKAREALNKLKSLPQQNGPQWTPEHHSVLSENVRLLIDSTSDPEVTQNKDFDDEYDEGDGEDQDAEENLAGQYGVDYEDNEGRNEATAQDTEQQQSLTPDSSRQGQKRRREENQDQSNGPHANSQTTQSRRPFKRSKLRTGITQHVLEEFETLQPQPLQFNFRSHPAEDRSDEWYIQQFRRLFRKLHDFAHDYFGLHDIDQGHFHQPWAAGMTPEFLRYVEDVATPDPMVGGWDPLLQNTIQREWLIVGIIMRILEIQVFGADLWGAEPQEKELLLGLERALLNREGFARTALRSNAVRSVLEQGAITTNFHTETAVLTAKVALLLKPLTFFLYSRPPRDGGMNRKIEDQYQALHNIIAIAAYLSICIRLSPTIFYFSSVTPNTRYEEDEHHSLDEECYTKSREAVVKAYDAEVKAYADKKAELEKVVAKLKAAGKKDTSRVYKKAKEKLNAHIETEPYDPDRTYELMTKIGVWPNISRYKPGTLEDDETGTPLEERRGFRIFDISKGAIVCYLGTEDRLKRAEQRVALEDFVKKKIKKYGKKDRGVGKGVVLAAAAAAAAAGIPYLIYGWTPATR